MYKYILMSSNRCIDILLMVSLASFVAITLPVSSVIISDYSDTLKYADGTCDGATLSNFTVDGLFFYHGSVNVVANVNGTEYTGYLYYPPIKHWKLGVTPKESIYDWYTSLNKTGTFTCYVDLSDPTHPMVNEWIEIVGYYIMLLMSLFIISGWTVIVFVIYYSQHRRRNYTLISDDLPPPYTVKPKQQQSLYKSLNDELTTISL